MAQTITPAGVRVYGVPMDLGQSRRGVDMGPSAIRYAGLKARLEALGWAVRDCGNIPVPVSEQILENEMVDGHRAYHLSAIAHVTREVHAHMLAAVEANESAIFLGGDHSISLGSVSGALYRAERTGLIWVDAHGDFNTPHTSPSGNIHGMVVSALTGIGPDVLIIGERRLYADQTVMIGTRDLDHEERINLRASGIKL